MGPPGVHKLMRADLPSRVRWTAIRRYGVVVAPFSRGPWCCCRGSAASVAAGASAAPGPRGSAEGAHVSRARGGHGARPCAEAADARGGRRRQLARRARPRRRARLHRLERQRLGQPQQLRLQAQRRAPHRAPFRRASARGPRRGGCVAGTTPPWFGGSRGQAAGPYPRGHPSSLVAELAVNADDTPCARLGERVPLAIQHVRSMENGRDWTD